MTKQSIIKAAHGFCQAQNIVAGWSQENHVGFVVSVLASERLLPQLNATLAAPDDETATKLVLAMRKQAGENIGAEKQKAATLEARKNLIEFLATVYNPSAFRQVLENEKACKEAGLSGAVLRKSEGAGVGIAASIMAGLE